jgi:hypothetical protein
LKKNSQINCQPTGTNFHDFIKNSKKNNNINIIRKKGKITFDNEKSMPKKQSLKKTKKLNCSKGDNNIIFLYKNLKKTKNKILKKKKNLKKKQKI